MSKLIPILVALILISCTTLTNEVAVSLEYPVLPVLTQKEANPMVKITLVPSSKDKKMILKKIAFRLDATNKDDVVTVGLYHANNEGLLDSEGLIGYTTNIANKIVIKSDLTLNDTLVLWGAIKLKPHVKLSHRYILRCTKISTDKGEANLPDVIAPKLRAGVALRQHMQDGIHTSRIPGLATTLHGTLLAIYDARYDSSRDLQGNIDICMNRSLDGGETWEPIQVVLDMKKWGGLPEKYNGVSDANILVDTNTGNIYVAGLWMHGVLDNQTGKWVKGLTNDSIRWIHQWKGKGSQPGLDVKQTCQFLITKSTDDGLTWSDPMNITRTCKREEWWLYAPAPGHGITLANGTLVIPTQGRDATGQPFSNIMWSKDGGKSWTASNPAFYDVTECMAVQLSNGNIMLNMRYNKNRKNHVSNGRCVFITNDLGESWVEHPTSRNALIEPTCMASIHKHIFYKDNKQHSILLFLNPEAIDSREHLTLKVSYDDGMTWPNEKKILLDEYKSRGYSCITSIDENRIGILYESSQADIVFQQINLQELLD